MSGKGRLAGLRIEKYEYPMFPWNGDSAELSEIFQGDSPGGATEAAVAITAEGYPPRNGLGEDGHGGNEGAVGNTEEELRRRLAEECRRAEERGWDTGMKMGITRGREETARQLAAERDRLHSQASALLTAFAGEQQRYFREVEEEAVRLALAIAARILRREAQMDPLLLTGAVRVALGQLAESTTVRLRVPAQDHSLWQEALTLIPGLPLRPLLVAEERMELGDCRLETELGSIDLGLKAQLREIERGFFDRAGGPTKGPSVNGPDVSGPAGPGSFQALDSAVTEVVESAK